MKIQSTRGRLLASTMFCGMAIGATAARAADAPAAAAPAAGQEIVVTGSRIPQPNLTSVSPITAISSQEIQLQGATNVENLLNNLPQVMASQAGSSSNGASGTATVNLRDLGSVRTLVLVDGTRLPPSDTSAPEPDLDQVPSALVDHIEVLTGGASATYGSDAVAGVVNFIMKKDLEGVRIDAQYGFAQHNQHNTTQQAVLALGLNANGHAVPFLGNQLDGFTKDVTVAIGVNAPDGKGNVTAYAGWREINPVLQDKRDWSTCAVFSNSGDDAHYCGGSSTVPQGKFQRVDIPGQPAYFGDATGSLSGPSTPYNYNPTNYLQRPQERYEAGYFAHYDVNDHLDVYSNLMFSDNHTDAQIAASGLFNGIKYPVNCDNPFLTAAAIAKLCAGVAPGGNSVLFIGRRTTELGPRTDDLRHTAYRINIGAKGDLIEGWSYDVYGQFADTIYSERYTGEVSIARAQKALQVVNVAGVPTCKSVINGSDPLCVPLNLFTTNSISTAAANYISGVGLKEGSATEQVVSGSITGDLGHYGMKSPMASDGIGVALGLEYRREAIAVNVDQEFATGDLAGQGGQTPNVNGAFDVKEVFGEIRIPIIQHMPGAELLQVEGGYRFSQYSNVGGTNTYKVGADWAPIPDVRFRAAYNRAVRAPNTVELFSAQALKLFGFSDPCAGAHPTASAAACAAQGVGVGGSTPYGLVIGCPAAQCTQFTEGNPSLTPETSDTYTVGAVFTPTFFTGFNASIDYYDINVQNLVGVFGASTIVNKCDSSFGTTAGNFFCGLIHRDPTTAVLFGTGFVTNTNVNTGFLHTKGIDFAAAYRTKFSDWHMGDWGSLAFNFQGTYISSFVTQPDPRIGQYECAGLFGSTCGSPVPKFRSNLRVTWGTPWDNLSLSVNWRFISSLKPDVSSSNPLLAGCAAGTPPASCLFGVGGLDPIDNIPAYNYFDLSAIWRVRDGVTLRAGVNNVFDKDPPVVDQSNLGLSSPPFGNGNTFPGTYDSLGRTIFIGLTADF
jgi:iron complex outermembrane receptor protein